MGQARWTRATDLAELRQCNDFCTVVTTYYGGIPICDIANDEDPVLCNSGDCLVCETIGNAFSNLFSNTPFDDDDR